MRRYVLTGGPGVGKTCVADALRARGYHVVREAATDVAAAEHRRGIDEPWRTSAFLDAIVRLQRLREDEADSAGGDPQVHDRSPVCTLALARWLHLPVPPALTDEVARARDDDRYEREVFLVLPLPTLVRTAVRRISRDDALRFHEVHETTYRELGYRLLPVPVGPVEQRADAVERRIAGPAA